MTDTAATYAARSLPLEPGGTVEISLSSGSVRVRGTDADRVVIRARDGEPGKAFGRGARHVAGDGLAPPGTQVRGEGDGHGPEKDREDDGTGRTAQDDRGAVHPAEGDPHVRPQVRGRLQALRQDRPQPDQLLREPLFDATRSGLAATCSSRFTSFSPEASKGGRPSSVNAERTAAQ